MLRPFTKFIAETEDLGNLVACQPFRGTLYRMPLCKHAAGASDRPRQLSEERLTVADAARLLDNHAEAAPDMLLSTKHISTTSAVVKEAENVPVQLLQRCNRSIRVIASEPYQVQDIQVDISHENGSQSSRCWRIATQHLAGGKTAAVAVLLSDSHFPNTMLPLLDGKVYCT